MTFGNISLPFNHCDTYELNCINVTDRYFQKPNESTSEKDLRKNNQKVPDFNSELKSDVNISNLTDCKIYTVEEFKKLDFNSNFTIYHCNINGLETKIDNLHSLLSSLNSSIDIICITETSLNCTQTNLRINTNLDGYVQFFMPTNSTKGGTSIYVQNKYDVLERSDLNITNDHFEANWIEIKNKNGKNLICGAVYRHPHNHLTNYSEFSEYLEKILYKMMKENKEIFVCGDFNYDLKVLSNNNTSKFYDLMSSFGLFPTILIPTRVERTSSTIIDNIFTNNAEKNLLSGVVETDLSDHFSQFITLKNHNYDLKAINLYSRDYSNFSEERKIAIFYK